MGQRGDPERGDPHGDPVPLWASLPAPSSHRNFRPDSCSAPAACSPHGPRRPRGLPRHGTARHRCVSPFPGGWRRGLCSPEDGARRGRWSPWCPSCCGAEMASGILTRARRGSVVAVSPPSRGPRGHCLSLGPQDVALGLGVRGQSPIGFGGLCDDPGWGRGCTVPVVAEPVVTPRGGTLAARRARRGQRRIPAPAGRSGYRPARPRPRH